MKVENAVHPNKEQMAGFLEPGRQGPIYMVNLLRFKDRAEYQDGQLNIETVDAHGLWLGQDGFGGG